VFDVVVLERGRLVAENVMRIERAEIARSRLLS
jgi:hypothetical protein